MADSFPILFTGRELDFDVPKFTEMNRAADNLQKKLQIEQAQQADLQKEFRDNMNVDMETFMSNYATQQQADMAKAFNDKWTLEVKKNGGKINNDILMGMQKDTNAMASRQKQWLQSQELWKRDKSLIEQSGGQSLYDMEKFGRDTEEFMRTGIYKPNSLEYSGVNMSALFDATKWTGRSTKAVQDVKTVNGKDVVTTTTYNATDPAEAKNFIASTILSNPRYLKGAQKEFMALDDKTKMKFLKDYDANGDGKLSPDEMGNVNMGSMNILENPVMQWAMSEDGYLPRVMRSESNVQEMPTKKIVTKVNSDDNVPTANVEWEQDGRKIKLTLKGKQAEPYLTPPDSNTDVVTKIEGAEAPYGDYTPPPILDGEYEFGDFKSDLFEFSDKAKGTDQSGYEVSVEKFKKKYGALAVKAVDSNGNITFRGTGTKGANSLITVPINSIVNLRDIPKLKVQTPQGIKTVYELLNGPPTTPGSDNNTAITPAEKMRAIAGK